MSFFSFFFFFFFFPPFLTLGVFLFLSFFSFFFFILQDWNGDEGNIPEIESPPPMNIDPVFMPNPIEVQKFSISNKAFHTQCSTKGLPRMNVTYVPQLYSTIMNSTSTTVAIQPPKKKISRGMFVECLYEAEEPM